jgi:antitoxin (DNA-binding transcriptional repressor) of toxin-antitoxin stability system
MVRTMAIHEVKDHLSSVIAELGESGDVVQITKHGRVVAVLSSPPPAGVVLGAGARPGGTSPDVEDLRWSPDDLSDFDGATFPS